MIFVLVYGIAVSFSMLFNDQLACFTIVNNWWNRRRGEQGGYVQALGGLGGVVFPPIVALLFMNFSWKTSLIIMAVLLVVITALPQWFLMKDHPAEMGLKIDGEDAESKAEKTDSSKAVGKKRGYYQSAVNWDVKDAVCTPQICRRILEQHLSSPAMLAVFPLQDWLATDPVLRAPDPYGERINVPSNPRHYWRYRMPLSLEELLAQPISTPVSGRWSNVPEEPEIHFFDPFQKISAPEMPRCASIQFQKLVSVARGGEVAHELVVLEQHRGAVVVRVESVAGPLAHPGVEEQVHVVRRVVYQPECRDRSGAQSEPPFHALFRGERELALVQPLFEVADRQPLFGVEAYQVVPVALVVAEKEVLAVLRAVAAAVAQGDFAGRGLRMFVPRVADAVGVEEVEHPLPPPVGRERGGCCRRLHDYPMP